MAILPQANTRASLSCKFCTRVGFTGPKESPLGLSVNSTVDDKYIERQIPEIPDAYQVLEDMYAKAPAEADIGKNSSAGYTPKT